MTSRIVTIWLARRVVKEPGRAVHPGKDEGRSAQCGVSRTWESIGAT